MTSKPTPKCGLLDSKTGAPVPLKGVSVEARIVDFIANVVITQDYANEEKVPIEASFIFPVEESAAVCAFQAIVDGNVIDGVVQENEEAKETYDNAIAQGHGAYMLEKVAKDVFQASIGNLPPGKQVSVRVTYVTELQTFGLSSKSSTQEDSSEKKRKRKRGKEEETGINPNAIVFRLASTVAPRYHSALSPSTENTTRLGQIEYQENAPYQLSLKAQVSMPSAIDAIEAGSGHQIKSTIKGNEASVELCEKAALDKDFILSIALAEPHKARAWMEMPLQKRVGSNEEPDRKELAAMLCFFPDLATEEVATEILFLIDRSGSMNGLPIKDASNTLCEALEALPQNTLINIIGFGSNYTTLFKESVPCNNENRSIALNHVKSLDADLGGTELFPPLEHIFNQRAQKQRARQVFLLTDGGVTNTDACIDLARKHCDTTRCFTFGIGSSVSTGLVKGIARAGKGEAEFVNAGASTDSLRLQVMRQIRRALQPALTEVSLNWKGVSKDEVMLAPLKLPPIFNGERYIVYAFLPPNTRKCEAILTANSPKGSFHTLIRSTHTTIEAARALIRLESLWAALILTDKFRELEEGDRGKSLGKDASKKEIIQLGTTYGLATEFTSFVCIDHREGIVTEDSMIQRSAPLGATSGKKGKGGSSSVSWGGGGAMSTRSKSQMYCKLPSNNKPKEMRISSTVIPTPFGFVALPSPRTLTDPYLTHVFKGPQNSKAGLDCWLNAVLALVMTIEPLREALLNPEEVKKCDLNSLSLKLAEFIRVWIGSHSSNSFSKELELAHRNVWQKLEQEFGFKVGQNHSVVNALNIILEDVAKYIPTDWEVLYTCNTENFSVVPKENKKFVIVFNTMNSPILHVINVKNYRLNSFISFEELGFDWKGDPINHFTSWAIDNKGYYVYDDLLRLQPRNFQGGFVPSSSSTFHQTLVGAQEKSPAFVMKRDTASIVVQNRKRKRL